jgi:colicin import membrane protein
MRNKEAQGSISEIENVSGIKSGAYHNWRQASRLFRLSRFSGLIRACGVFSLIGASAIWLFLLVRAGLPPVMRPWFVFFSITFSLGLLSFRKKKAAAPNFALPGAVEEANALQDWLNFSYLGACLLSLFILAKVSIEPLNVPKTSRQVIDIELTSTADYSDQKEILPSTEPKPKLKKQTGDAQEIISENEPNPAIQPRKSKSESATKNAAEASEPAKNRKVAIRNLQPNQELQRIRSAQPLVKSQAHKKSELHQESQASQEETLDSASLAAVQPAAPRQPQHAVAQPAAPKQRQYVAAAPPKNFPWRQYAPNAFPAKPSDFKDRFVQVTASTSEAQPIEIEEVHPPQLMEVTDTDGETGAELWQAGGRSSGGKGAPSLLNSYLKEIHKKLKRAWMPPGDRSSRAQILFRIRRDGSVAFLRLVKSSGDSEVDQSAIQAIRAAQPFGVLPKDYLPEALDVSYSFNFRADQLTEVTAR